MPSPIDEDVVSEATKRLVSEFDPEVIYLFGSRAWGRPREESDLDIMVVVAASAESPVQRETRAYHVLEGLDVRKDVLVRTRAEFDARACVASLMESRILRDGKVLYGL